MSTRFKPIVQDIPRLICWQLWKKRNRINHGRSMPINRVMYETNVNLHHLTINKFPWLKEISSSWTLLVDFLQNYRAQLKTILVVWKSSNLRWYKCSSNGASRGNHGMSSIAFCIANGYENIRYVYSR